MGASIYPQNVGRFILKQFRDADVVTIGGLLKKMKARGIVPGLGGGAGYMEDDEAREFSLYLNWEFWFSGRDTDILRPISAGRGGGYPKAVQAFLESGSQDFDMDRYAKKFHAVKWSLTDHARLLPFRDLPLHPGYGDF